MMLPANNLTFVSDTDVKLLSFLNLARKPCGNLETSNKLRGTS